jgi:hypothetical protein
MKLRIFISVLCCFAVASASVSLFGQAAEISPYGGFYWPGNNNAVGEFRNNQILGVRGGGYVTPSFEIGANYAWSNHFQPSDTNAAATFAGDLGFPQSGVRSNLWEAEFAYNFGKHGVHGATVRPYLVMGGGVLITSNRDNGDFVLNVRSFQTPNGIAFAPNDVLSDNSKFFTFSYGGGLKAARLAGPLGFFGDLRGRTIPNFFNGHGTNWPEVSAGLYFSWGER